MNINLCLSKIHAMQTNVIYCTKLQSQGDVILSALETTVSDQTRMFCNLMNFLSILKV